MSPGLPLKEGSEVEHGDRRFVIMQVVGFDAVVARDVETRDLERLSIAELQPVRSAPDPPAPDLSELDDRDWDEARRRLDLIAPLLDGARPPRAAIVERARTGDVDATTLYRWARTYRASGRLSSLLPYKPGGGRGKSRLPPAVERILMETIEEHFLTRQTAFDPLDRGGSGTAVSRSAAPDAECKHGSRSNYRASNS